MTHRPRNLITHRAARKGETAMESYRNAIIRMLDTITDAGTMRMIYDIIHAIFVSRG